jgi:hypothetical protein
LLAYRYRIKCDTGIRCDIEDTIHENLS